MGCFHGVGLYFFPSTHAAVGVLRRQFGERDAHTAPGSDISEWEAALLQCLLAISIIMQESSSGLIATNTQDVYQPIPLDELELFLRDSTHLWGDSIPKLCSILCESLKRLFAEGELKLYYVLDAVQVLSTLSLEARQGVEKCLLNLLYCLGSNDYTSNMLVDDGWTPDSLLSSVHGY